MSIATFSEPIQVRVLTNPRDPANAKPVWEEAMMIAASETQALVVVDIGFLRWVSIERVLTNWRWDAGRGDWVDLSDGPLQDPEETP